MADSATEHKQDEPKKKARKPLQILRERRGGLPKDLVQRNRSQTALRRKIVAALETGPKTVPELSAETGIPTDQTLYFVMALKKYGKVAEGAERDDYYEYVLIEEKKT